MENPCIGKNCLFTVYIGIYWWLDDKLHAVGVLRLAQLPVSVAALDLTASFGILSGLRCVGNRYKTQIGVAVQTWFRVGK